MTAKIAVVERLGERAVLLPSLLGEALEANDRLKLRMSLLQEASVQAAMPGRQPRDFGPERRASGLADPALDRLIAGARAVGPGKLLLPGADALLLPIASDLAAMLAPLEAAGADTGGVLARRVEAVEKSIPVAAGDTLGLADIEGLTSASPDGPESLHLLVMDLHKALNRLAAETAVETLDGARVHGLAEEDRRRVKSFMRGLNRTAPLAFGHPGLGTTAVRAGGRLTIQNDIGTTEAHVLVVHVEPEAVTITYTDVHHIRAKFFVCLFAREVVAWTPLGDKPEGELGGEHFYLLTGRHEAADEAALERFLEFLGSRLVFLIDWNKARKALQTFVGKSAAFGLLSWAAEHDFGHRAFLELGGADLVFDTVQRAATGRIPYGARLDTALGTAECVQFLEHVLRDTSQGLAAGRTARLIRDEIQADLAHRFETAEGSVLTVLVRHLGLTRMLAGRIADILAVPGLTGPEERRAFAARAKAIEEKADGLTLSAREVAARIREAGKLRPLIDEIENSTDALEDCAFLLSLVPAPDEAALDVAPLARLSTIVLESAGHLVRAVEAASRLPQGERADAVAALQAIDQVVVAERSADAAERDMLATVMLAPREDAKSLVLSLELARALETATDRLSHSALMLRDRVLEDLSA
ncbi:MAG TPA: hypothetical protein VMF62_12530 [Acetobacteraceae bacterium]|nr:hypothetical protein [Acetobacteraceae bacterium]